MAAKRIVVLGGGFAGVECVKHLEKGLRGNSSTEIFMISEDNFLLFTPMLPQVASGTIETRNIVMPIRTILKKARFYEGRVKDIDPKSRKVSIWGTPEKSGVAMDYDYLVVALGSETNFFGMSDLETNSFQMKTLNDAVSVRNRIIDMLEQADNETDPDVKRSLLTFVIVGGGFAGIETAGGAERPAGRRRQVLPPHKPRRGERGGDRGAPHHTAGLLGEAGPVHPEPHDAGGHTDNAPDRGDRL